MAISRCLTTTTFRSGHCRRASTPSTPPGVSRLLAYERAHGNRLPVVLVLERRLDALGNGAEPSGSLPPDMPELSEGQGGSPVSPQTSGPPINPPSQGDPTNPALPR